MRDNRLFALVPALLLLVALSPPALGLGMEEVGNAPLSELNYDEWKGTDIMPVVNHTSRVYYMWVNGNENFYYSGDAKALNDILEKYAATELDVREVEIRPGPAGTSMFDGTAVPYDWRLHLLTGIVAAVRKASPGSEIWLGEKNPTLTIFIGSGNFELKDVTVPVGITLVGPNELRERYLAILKRDDDERKQAAHALVALNPANPDNIPVFLEMIGKGNEALNAACDGLEKMGRNARSALPAMKELLSGQDELAQTRLLDAIDAIEEAPDTSEKDGARLKILAEIADFIARTRAAHAVEQQQAAARD